MEKSSQVNKAYKIFNNQDETIKYVLQLKGLLEDEEKFMLPNDFLMQMMELNEELLDATMEQDANKVESIKQSISNIQHSIFSLVKNIITAETIENISSLELLKVKEYYFKKKYLARILDGIH